MGYLEKIKYILRGSRYYRKYFQTTVNSLRYYFRNLHYYWQLYSFKKDREVSGNTLYFIIDPNIKHPGLVDRFKAIVGLFYVAKINGFDFKVIFNHPFKLEEYLSVNKYNWIANQSELSYSLQNVRLIPYNGSGKIPRLSKTIKQYHVYCYIGNALENFEKDQFNSLTEDKRENLIQRCLKGIRLIIDQNKNKQIVVFSDSKVFLERVKVLPVIVLDGKVGHISFTENTHEVAMKTFVDFYAISKASRVIRILAPEMYNTVFSYYAAVLGGIIPEELHV